jgi:hypothetical protein
MQSIIWTGRNLSRALINGICSRTNSTTNSASAAEPRTKSEPHLISAICGFPKQFRTKRRTSTPKGQIGEDAWFSVRHKALDVLGKPFNHTSPFTCPRLRFRTLTLALLAYNFKLRISTCASSC